MKKMNKTQLLKFPIGTLLLAGVLAGALSGCEGVKSIVGQSKSAPDEFAVYSRAPLSLPPDYGLRPPAPGTLRPQGVDPRAQSRKTLLGDRAGAGGGPLQAGEQALLNRLGAANPDPDIRRKINQESAALAEESASITDRLMFWNKPNEYGTVVDPKKESKRIRENMALGKSVTEGETPIIERKRKGFLEGIF